MRPTLYFEGPIDKLNWHVIKLLWPYLLEYKGRVALAMSCLIVAKLASVGLPFILKDIVDTLDVNKTASHDVEKNRSEGFEFTLNADGSFVMKTKTQNSTYVYNVASSKYEIKGAPKTSGGKKKK